MSHRPKLYYLKDFSVSADPLLPEKTGPLEVSLNYKPKVSLQDGLAKFIKWYESKQLEEMIVKN